MVDILRIKRRASGGAAGAPASLLNAELAYNEVDDKLYYGKGNASGAATSIIPIAGPGMGYVTGGPFLPLAGGQLSGPLAINRAIPAGGNAGNIFASSTVTTGNLGFNGYVNAAATSWLHLTGTGTGGAFSYDTSGNQFAWYTFPNAAAGAAVTLTPIMTLTSGGLTLTGPSSFVSPASGWAQMIVNKPTAADAAAFLGQRAGVARWYIYVGNTTAEAGSNAGSNFAIDRFSDTGAYLGTPITITRSTGLIDVASNLTLSKRLTLYPSATNVCDLVIENTNGAYISIYNDGQPHIYSSTNQIYLDSAVIIGSSVVAGGSVLIPNNAGYASKDTGGNTITLLYMANNNAIYIAPNGQTMYVGGHMVSIANNTYLLGNTGNAFSNVVAYAFTNASDIRDKAEIETLPDCLSLVQAIEPKRYKFNNALEEDRDRVRWGFIAQEVGATMREAGHDFGGHYIGDDKKQSEALSYHDLMTVLWKAVQELSAEVATLKARSQ